MAFEKVTLPFCILGVLLGCREKEHKVVKAAPSPDAAASAAPKEPTTVVELIDFIKSNAFRPISQLCETLVCNPASKAMSLPTFGGAILSSSPDDCGNLQTNLQLPLDPVFSVQQLIAAWGPPKEFDREMKAPIGKYTFDAQKLDVIFFTEVGVNALRFQPWCGRAIPSGEMAR